MSIRDETNNWNDLFRKIMIQLSLDNRQVSREFYWWLAKLSKLPISFLLGQEFSFELCHQLQAQRVIYPSFPADDRLETC